MSPLGRGRALVATSATDAVPPGSTVGEHEPRIVRKASGRVGKCSVHDQQPRANTDLRGAKTIRQSVLFETLERTGIAILMLTGQAPRSFRLCIDCFGCWTCRGGDHKMTGACEPRLTPFGPVCEGETGQEPSFSRLRLARSSMGAVSR
jgi:hypothetical protein